MSFDIEIDNGASAGGGGFFKPAEHESATVIIFEPKGSATSQFKDRDGNDQLNAIADFTVFSTKAELKNKKPGVVMEDGQTSGVLGKILIEKGKGVVVGTVEQTEGKAGKRGYWKVAPVDPSLIPEIKAYLADREEKKQAERDGLPDWAK